jgi:hypothetical protein
MTLPLPPQQLLDAVPVAISVAARKAAEATVSRLPGPVA